MSQEAILVTQAIYFGDLDPEQWEERRRYKWSYSGNILKIQLKRFAGKLEVDDERKKRIGMTLTFCAGEIKKRYLITEMGKTIDLTGLFGRKIRNSVLYMLLL